MNTPPDAAKAATPRQPESMRERMACAYFQRAKKRNLEILNSRYGGLGGKSLRGWSASDRSLYRETERTTWDSLEQRDRDGYLDDADVAIDCLTAPTPGMIEAGKDTQVSHCWGSKGEFISDPESIWEAMVRAMKEGK